MTHEFRDGFCEGWAEMKEKVEDTKKKYEEKYKNNEEILKVIENIFEDILSTE